MGGLSLENVASYCMKFMYLIMYRSVALRPQKKQDENSADDRDIHGEIKVWSAVHR